VRAAEEAGPPVKGSLYASTGSQKKVKKKHFREAAQDLMRRKYIYISAKPFG
jgi:hypothetical protein